MLALKEYEALLELDYLEPEGIAEVENMIGLLYYNI